MQKLKESYNLLKKKHNLPDFDLIESEYELNAEEETNFPLRHIRKEMTEQLEHYLKVIEEMINPESSIVGLYECKIFDDDKKEALFMLFKKMMWLVRFSLETALDEDEDKDANFVKTTFSEWKEIKSKLKPFVKEIKESWRTEINKKEELGYFG